jgi:hypothetical protein
LRQSKLIALIHKERCKDMLKSKKLKSIKVKKLEKKLRIITYKIGLKNKRGLSYQDFYVLFGIVLFNSTNVKDYCIEV